MKKTFLPIILSIILGFFMGFYLFHEYDSNVKIKSVFNESKETVYFLQLGVYSTLESAKERTKDFNNYIYTEEEDGYHIYIGITKSLKNAENLKGIFKEKGYTIYVKEKVLNEEKFITKLTQYDQILEKATEEEAILKVLEQILNTYKEEVIDGNHH